MIRRNPSKRSSILNALLASLMLALLASVLSAVDVYQKPPKEVLDVLDAPPTPTLLVSPAKDRALLITTLRYPPISDLAQPMLRIAGLRLNPKTNGPHHPTRHVAYTLKWIDTGKEIKIAVPPNAYLSMPEWSGDGMHFAFSNTTSNSIELWVGDATTGAVHKMAGVVLNAAYGDTIKWMPDNKTLLIQTIPAGRGKSPEEPLAPKGPIVQESSGKAAPIRTYEDLLQSPHDEDLFDYYCTAQLAFVDLATGKVTPFGKPGLFANVTISPDGKLFTVTRTHKPYSYLFPAGDFPKEIVVWDRAARVVFKLVDRPLQDQIPVDGVPVGPRNDHWRPNEPATLVWVEAMDGGNPKTKAEFRDRVLMLRAPFKDQPTELIKLTQRFAGGMGPRSRGLVWGEKGGMVFVGDYDRNRRWVRTFMLDADHPAQTPKLVWDRSIQDRYNDPGEPVLRTLPSGQSVLMQEGDSIFLSGAGASPGGDRPFLDRFDLKTLKADRLFRCDEKSYESVVAVLTPDAGKFLTRYESPSEPPNYFIHTARGHEKKALTHFPDPTPQLQGIRKQLVKYKRNDGVDLSFTLYLPAGYKEGTPLPTVVWAYPLEYNDPATAGQVSGSANRFSTFVGYTHLFFLTQGYAVLDGATMPVIGDPETMNNTYIEQIVASAQAAIDKAVEMGVTDRNRVGVGGHSYGAFMTANLLAHSRLFKAGIARSGAYNRTLTAFGFQSERRNFWEAPEMYFKVSPFVYANNINDPILLIHGMADNNSGTFPIQSERMYAAIKGNGGTVRYVQLPFEAHGYQARESIEDVLYEMITFFNKYVRDAK
ncbi:MAG: prolyl oligopeptidase family serine peptidase [Acidobacteriia bacterium]|nr:prolyl oligopeptidase family serine peptidase [Terriglobia bacterium]